MKNLFIFTILIYQKIFSSMFKNMLGARSFCRFSPSCSEYARISISRHGAKRGVLMSVSRLLKCQPFYKSEYQNPKSETIPKVQIFKCSKLF